MRTSRGGFFLYREQMNPTPPAAKTAYSLVLEGPQAPALIIHRASDPPADAVPVPRITLARLIRFWRLLGAPGSHRLGAVYAAITNLHGLGKIDLRNL